LIFYFKEINQSRLLERNPGIGLLAQLDRAQVF